MSDGPRPPDLVEIVRRANDAFNRRDVDAWMSFFSPDIVYRPVPRFPDSQERQGLNAMRRWMEEWHDAWADGSTAMS
jgi:ketosteroid isomerase-like protein